MSYEQIHQLEEENVQSIWIRCGFKNSKKAVFCHTYREHTNTMGNTLKDQRFCLEKLLTQWENASCLRNSTEEIHICGDMNLDYLNGNWMNRSYHLFSLTEMVQAACDLSNLHQLVKEYTRVQHNSVSGKTSLSCIDHIYTNHKHRCSEVEVIPFGNSDHDFIQYVRYSKAPPAPSRTIRKRSYKAFVKEDFLSQLEQIDWTPVYSCRDVDLAVDIFTWLFRNVLDQHAPWVVYQLRKSFTPWVTPDTVEMIKKRDETKARATNLAKAGKDCSEDWAEFKKLRNTINNRIKYEERTYKSKIMRDNSDNPSKCWQLAKTFMNWNTAAGSPTQLESEGRLVLKAAEIASIMNKFFIDKVSKIRDCIENVPTSFVKCYTMMRGKRCKLSLQHVSIKSVYKILKGLKTSKSTSIDGLDNFSTSLSAEIICKPLHHIITLALMQQKFPTLWKNSKVIPLHKKSSKLDCKNYRPVSILSPLSKVLEKILYQQM